ncbi:molecular chaperone DnaK [candidate division CPR3 bacterium 4484_211]|uniref:Molecular chaperone DnaK n=1 Tax=candidate division CPR3 bacterium 4484_211 TaxID=1968527 RepID=A0A1W9NY00_UNCC3|nr:MAG: molecular chaperone DnaK [candidate division CPR3 bacterium 4484_211]
MSKIVGIDLGTTNSVVAVMEGGQPKVIHSSEGENLFPSVVDPVKNIVGRVAKRQIIAAPKRTIFSIKRLMGRKYSDPEVQRDKEWLPYTIKEGKEGMAVVEVEGKTYTPQEISAMILQKIKADAEAYLGQKVEEAVIAYGLGKQKNERIAVFDLGGGTFDISILEIESKGEEERDVFQVLATNGDTHLGGDDFDQKIIDFLTEEFRKDTGIDLKKDSQALQRLRDAAEKAKIELSTRQETEINLPFITADESGPKHLAITLTRAKLESLVEDLIDRCFNVCSAALKDAGLNVDEIDEVVLVGGQTRMPKIQARVKEYFGKEPHKGINPDEVVAVGAAVQAGVFTGESKEVLLLDVTPLTLGIETLGGVRTPLIDRNTTIPTSKTQIFSTAADNQTSVEINVLQGERPMAADNKSLGKFILSGIPPAPRGVPQIEVTFDLDANGILNVSAKDKATGKEQKITITGSTGLSKEEIERMRQEAQAHAAEDQQKKERIEAKNQAEALCYTAEKTLKDVGDKVPQETKSKISQQVEQLRSKLESASAEDLKREYQALSEALQKVGAAMYQSAGQQPENEAKEKKEEAKDKSDENKSSEPGSQTVEGEIVDEDDK